MHWLGATGKLSRWSRRRDRQREHNGKHNMANSVDVTPATPVGPYQGQHSEGRSIGAHRVRESFNPSQDNTVDKINRLSADLIDLCETLKPMDVRCASLAQTAYEDAAMWAVKAATTPKA